MSKRSTARGGGAPGGPVEYPGDLTPPIASYAGGPMHGSSIGRKLRIPGSRVDTNSGVVSSKFRRGGARGGQVYFYSYGPLRMRTPLMGPPGYGSVVRSGFQQYNNQLIDWQLNPSWAETGYPANLGLSHRQPQLPTNASGGPSPSTMGQRPLFTGVQQVPRPRVQIRTYNTRGQ